MKNIKAKSRISELERTISKRIYIVRIARNLTQTDIGKKIGVSYQQFRKFEIGTDRPSVLQLYKLAKATNIDLKFFLEDIIEFFKDKEE